MKPGICKLCLAQRKLIKKSHVIPRFMYGNMFDDGKTVVPQSLKDNVVSSGKTIQTGYYDKYIICQHCENDILGKLDRYGANVLYKGNNDLKANHGPKKDGLRPLFVTGIEYDNFKVFLLSILWRAHISINPFFENIDLAASAEIIRKTVLNNLHVDDSVYRVQIFALKYNPTELQKIVVSPLRIVADGADFYAFIINGVAYLINMQLVDEPSFFAKGFLRNDGSVEVHELDQPLAIWFLRSFFKIGLEGVQVASRSNSFFK
jgi:hypothetical protein